MVAPLTDDTRVVVLVHVNFCAAFSFGAALELQNGSHINVSFKRHHILLKLCEIGCTSSFGRKGGWHLGRLPRVDISPWFKYYSRLVLSSTVMLKIKRVDTCFSISELEINYSLSQAERTALMSAAFDGQVKIAQILITAGAIINRIDLVSSEPSHLTPCG